MARSVTILGAGLVGSLLAIILRKKGYEVTIYERRDDMRSSTVIAGRSINLAMSERGWKALDLAGIRKDIEEITIPMYGRYLHQRDGSSAFQQYGRNKEAIYSVSRGALNARLMDCAEAHGAKILFNQKCSRVDVATNTIHLLQPDGTEITVVADLLAGSDGAFSSLRTSYTYQDRVNAAQHYIEHGYKELNIPVNADGKWAMDNSALHIWPRNNFMLIALPNQDGSFTCTLFFPFEGTPSFNTVKTPEEISAFFKAEFPDALKLMPTLVEDFQHNPTSPLITTHINPWYYKNKSFLIGDAAHAIVPFYGQGMNAGFEDVTTLAGLIDELEGNWDKILPAYSSARKPNGDAVAELALLNFVEMRDKVADPAFLERKKIEKELGKRYPQHFTSVYEMVSFSHAPYSHAMHCIQAQDRLLQQIMSRGDFNENITDSNFCTQLDRWLEEYRNNVAREEEVN